MARKPIPIKVVEHDLLPPSKGGGKRRKFIGSYGNAKKNAALHSEFDCGRGFAIMPGAERPASPWSVPGTEPLIEVMEPTSPSEKYTVEQVAEALIFARGMIAGAARILRTGPGVVKGYIKRHSKLRALADQLREALLDMAETRLIGQVEAGNLEAIKFYLRCKGKHRGYTERGEAPKEKNINIKIIPAPGVEINGGQLKLIKGTATDR